MYIYICIYLCIYIHIYLCIYIHIRIYIYIYRNAAGAVGAVVLSAVLLACCLVIHQPSAPSSLLGFRYAARQQALAYDGPFDTPPVTWYYPASSTNENTLGYTWNNAEMQNTAVTYVPGPTGDATSAYPLGTNVEYQNGEEMYRAKRPLHPATLKFMQSRDKAQAEGWPAQFQSLV